MQPLNKVSVMLLATLLVACGGGGGVSASSATANITATNYQTVIANAVGLPAAGTFSDMLVGGIYPAALGDDPDGTLAEQVARWVAQRLPVGGVLRAMPSQALSGTLPCDFGGTAAVSGNIADP